MNLRNIDLNLLVALDALLTERNVSRAGRRLGLSQPAASSALARLRKLFQDPLLVRRGREFTLTTEAERLAQPVREILSLVERTIANRPEFDPRTDTRMFRISASDYATLILLSPFMQYAAAEAPGVTIHVIPRSSDPRQLLRTGEADLVIEPRELLGDTSFPSQGLFSDRWLCAVDAAHPAAPQGRLSLEAYLQLPHCVYSIGPDRELDFADQHLARLGTQRRIELTVESFLLVPFLIRGTTLASLVLERAARQLAAAATGIQLLPAPLPLPDIHETMHWHPGHDTDPAHLWLREQLLACAQNLDS
ncbi:LysR family transcriptional regulator [Streptomyces kunmingensis]|uniref:LysR family transcriptional regulator n=1 Tax=Streptomyces kunmingensis TaxID=68225 RepID=A0ABU6C696_9ACTN|nr:LysR family transcriptional regulator [Streptomyces kunmingensis]MEB3959626.1 LysR family transcriptional regulator [Streptomyces kunmingensis]